MNPGVHRTGVSLLTAALLVGYAGPAWSQAPGDLGPTTTTVDLGVIPLGPLSGVRARLISDITIPQALTQMAIAPGFADSVFFSERTGQIIRVDLTNPNPYANFTTVGSAASVLGTQFGDGRTGDEISAGDGMRGLAFHPDFANTGTAGYGKFYTVHEEVYNSGSPTFPAPDPGDPTGRQDSVLTEWTYNPNTGVFLNTPREVMRAPMVDGHHPMQQIAFNPTVQPGQTDYGNLYIAVGDGGLNPTYSFGGSYDPDPADITQATDNVHGKILRINPLQDGANAYSVPTGADGNAFANDADAATLAEIYAYGFRNPQTIGFNPMTGDMFVGDIGQNQLDEINLIENGGNYGWGVREGTYVDGVDSGSGPVYDGLFQEVLPDARDADGFTYPVLQFSQYRGGVKLGPNAVVGGYVYNGDLAQELSGLYLFGNLSNTDIFYADASDLVNDNDPAGFFQLQLEDDLGNPITLGNLIGSNRTLMRFGQDADGEIYIFSQRTGQVFRLEGTRMGDLNGDFVIDEADLAIVLGSFGRSTTPGSLAEGDPTGDGLVNIADLNLVLSKWTSSSPPPIVVPEPGSAALLGLVGLALMRRRRA